METRVTTFYIRPAANVETEYETQAVCRLYTYNQDSTHFRKLQDLAEYPRGHVAGGGCDVSANPAI